MNPYKVDTSESNLLGPMTKLNVLYDRMPGTTGCEKCKEVNGDNAMWCCKSQSPSMYYAEFLNVWRNVEKKWSKEKRLNVIIRSISNYLYNGDNKGCVFFDNGCTVYENRPYSCRIYGVVSQESWDRRENVLKKRFGEDIKITPQCNMVSLENGDKSISLEMEDIWFEKTMHAELELGVSKQYVQLHDAPGGSYRTFHDHILLELFDVKFLGMLTQYRLSNPSKEDIEGTIEFLRKKLEEEGVVS